MREVPEMSGTMSSIPKSKWVELGPLDFGRLELEITDGNGDQLRFVKMDMLSGTYIGTVNKLDQHHGCGRFIRDDNAIFEGQFSNGKLNGYARLIFPDGSWYEGQFSQNLKHG